MTPQEIAATAKGIVQMQAMIDRALERYEFHMTQVRRGRDADLRDMHLRAADREYATAWMGKDQIDRTFDRVREV